ncbi:hypothetical protein SCUP234_08339 [Seiridium cupressi]
MQLTKLPSSAPENYNLLNSKAKDRIPMSHEPYVALSYVWGTKQNVYRTLLENVMIHRMHGGLEKELKSLPKVILDTIDLVRRLGYKYLWVDRLCIVQDSLARSWKLNAYNMDLIYGNADLTICAADGDAAAGLHAMSPGTHNTKQCRGRVAGLNLMVTRPPEMYIRSSEWNERAWTFQERLLSRRCLIFTNSRVYFQCRSTGMSEDIYADRKGAGWSLDLKDAPMQMLRQLDSRPFWVYMKSIELYTERKLSNAADILAAFSGMSNLINEHLKAPFIHGLPSSHFDLALLWEPVSVVRRRVLGDDKDGKDSRLSAEKKTNNSVPDFPSWSWAGWEGPVAYKDSVATGLLDNVSDWLDSHTWIEWWVRDGHGDLRPLMDWNLSKVSVGEERWKGYRSPVSRNNRPRKGDQYKPEEKYNRRENIIDAVAVVERHVGATRSKSGWTSDSTDSDSDSTSIADRDRRSAHDNIRTYDSRREHDYYPSRLRPAREDDETDIVIRAKGKDRDYGGLENLGERNHGNQYGRTTEQWTKMDFDIHHHYADERGFFSPDIPMTITVYRKPGGVGATT